MLAWNSFNIHFIISLPISYHFDNVSVITLLFFVYGMSYVLLPGIVALLNKDHSLYDTGLCYDVGMNRHSEHSVVFD